MENGIFISLANWLYAKPDWMLKATVIGLVSTPILFIVMPIRAVKVISNGFRIDASDQSNLNKLAWAFLAVACYGLIELIFMFVNAKAGDVNGLMIPMFTVLPTLPYLGFEICYGMSRGVRPKAKGGNDIQN